MKSATEAEVALQHLNENRVRLQVLQVNQSLQLILHLLRVQVENDRARESAGVSWPLVLVKAVGEAVLERLAHDLLIIKMTKLKSG